MGNALNIMRRRRLIFQYWSQNIMAPETIKELLEGQGITISTGTIKRDLSSMEEWLPELVNIEGDEEEIKRVLNEKIARIQSMQDRLAQIAYAGDSSSAQVGAALGVMKAVREELDVRARMGQLSPHTVGIKTEVEYPAIGEEELSRYIGVIVETALDFEARELNEGPVQPDSK